MEPPPAFPKPGSVMDIRNVQMAVTKPKPCAVSLSGFFKEDLLNRYVSFQGIQEDQRVRDQTY